MPSCFAASESVRTRMNIQSALSAYDVQTFWPFSDEVVAVADGLGLQAREVGAGAGLGVALAPADLAADDRRQVLALQLLAALLEEERADHREAEADERRAEAELRHLLGEHLRLRLREPAAAVLARPRRRRPAALRHDGEPALHVGGIRALLAAPAEVVGAPGRRATSTPARWRRASAASPRGTSRDRPCGATLVEAPRPVQRGVVSARCAARRRARASSCAAQADSPDSSGQAIHCRCRRRRSWRARRIRLRRRADPSPSGSGSNCERSC